MTADTVTDLLSTATWVTIDLLLIGIVLAIWRIARGPDPADRIVGLDLLSVLVVAILAAFAIHTGRSAYLDVAIAYALVAFLGTVALARFLEGRGGAGRPAAEDREEGGPK
jgi:multicomponent Na+:H+ antiporter subunit F